jgi:hypothetical protein
MQDRFRIDRIELTDFRCFETLALDLHADVTLLVGPNGQGKSAVLDAIAAVAAAPVAVADVRFGRSATRVDATGFVDGLAAFWFTILDRTGRRDHHAPEQLYVRPEPFPVLVKYGAERLVQGSARPEDRSPPDPERWWDPKPFWSDLVTWVRRETMADLQQGAPGPALQVVRAAIVECLRHARITDFRYDIRSETLMVEVDGGSVPFDVASGGVRALVALVADLATRCWLRNPSADAARSPGLVLIDEVELHLHPRWQREMLPALRRAFPNLQIVASTHSPQVVASVEAECVRVLTTTEARSVEATWGRTADTVLEDVFGVPARPEPAQQELHELFRLIDADDPSARDRLAEAERRYGKDDPDVARARFLLEMA